MTQETIETVNTPKIIWVVYSNTVKRTYNDGKCSYFDDYQETFLDKDKAITSFKYMKKNSRYNDIWLKEINLTDQTVKDLSNQFNGNALKLAGKLKHLVEYLPVGIERVSTRVVDNKITISLSVSDWENYKIAFDIIFDKILRENQELFNTSNMYIKFTINSKKYREFDNK